MTTQDTQSTKKVILFAYYSQLANTYFMYKSMRMADDDDYVLKYSFTCKPLPNDARPTVMDTDNLIGKVISDWRGNMYEILAVKEMSEKEA